ncbi:MAG: S1C family serine protease [Bacillota bacterium]
MNKEREYWNVPLTPEQREDLGLDENQDLNELPEGEPEHEQPHGKKTALKLISFFTFLAFIIIMAGGWFQALNLPPLGFIFKSRDLARSPWIQELQQGVVVIETAGSKGTGFNIEPSGLIVTNHHVIKDAKAVFVRFSSGGLYKGTEWVSYPEVDLAVITIEGQNLPMLNLDHEGALTSGEEVLVIGNPLGFPQVVAKGKFLGLTPLKGWEESVMVIRGPIHKGSSGSPVINREGRVAGVIFGTLELSNNKGGETIGLAVPVKSLPLMR